MKIDKFHIRSRFKNLENVSINFAEASLMTVIVGLNGSGKSNVLEALVSIFRNLDLGESPPFSYALTYQLGDAHSDRWDEIEIDADPSRLGLSKQYQITIKKLKLYGAKKELNAVENPKDPLPFSKVKRDPKSGVAPYLPKYLFAYYSGPSDRLESYFRKHRTDFYNKLLKNEVDLKGDIRPLFYAKPFHSQFVLLAFFLSAQEDNEKKFLRDELGIENLDSVHFVMRRPSWAKKKGELFWGAHGVVRKFLDELFPYALAPIKVTRGEDTTLTGSQIKNEFFHLFLPDVTSLRNFAKNLSPDELFKMLESTLLSEMISEVSVRVKITSTDESLTFRELSEGEQQLLTVLGLLKFTGGKDSLFLLDEPDTHLNPSWAVKYLSFLERFVPNHETSHLLMVTHHPLAIAELDRSQVQVMKRTLREIPSPLADDNSSVMQRSQITASMPNESPRGMGINLILRSDMFGLKTTLDNKTNEKIIERNKLASKESLQGSELKKLDVLNEELDKLGFNFISDDPDYTDFLNKKYHQKNDEAK
ncbi:AAA family ATPase [Undibacterium umbellatum]|uniref:AAA family ATPase n=1 Tax=Undibacterium umbellatum TaxID=2762300 RepID=A0ABR6Z979_9BURK|nr:ATP-binding protein [Undibacterium umbellatum]MBC3908228.1 AAA family ATPase [Undibacterium umbellatum]